MIPILAWRNIWRNPTRSIVVILAIALGIWAALVMTGFATGMVQNYIASNISNVVAHLQIHHPSYAIDRDVHKFLAQSAEVENFLDQQKGIQSFSVRTLANGMASSAKGSRGVSIRGVDPYQEASISNIRHNIIDGTYFDTVRKNQALIGQKLAEKLNLKLNSKIILTFQDLEGDIVSGAFRIVGLFQSGNTPFDEGNVFVARSDLQPLLNPKHPEQALIHEIAIICGDLSAIPQMQQTIQRRFATLKTENYHQIAPDLQLYESQIELVAIIYLSIIMLALIFGIVNTMLMAVLERFRELGMLMAIGMNKKRLFSMIVLETILLSLIGAPLGMGMGAGTIHYFKINGLDLSAFAESLNKYGLGTTVHFSVAPEVYWQTTLILSITALLASIYPAYKAIRLNPAEAIRKI